MLNLKCSCKGSLYLDYLDSTIIKDGNTFIVVDCPQLVCHKCSNSYFPYQVKEMCECVIDKCFNDDKNKDDTMYLNFSKIRNIFCSDKFISTKVGFLYDRDDYYFLPGLIREFNKGFLTPVFFNIEVLLKYMHHPKYSVDLGANTYGQIYMNDEHMIPFGINENNKIIMWLGDIRELSVEEQFYLRSENVQSDHSISSEFYEGQIDVMWAEPSEINRLLKKRFDYNEKVTNNYKVKITQLDTETVQLAKNIYRPIVNTDEEFSSIIIAMNKLFVEAISSSEIKSFLKKNHPGIDLKSKGGLKVYQEWLNLYIDNIDINNTICPLYVLYDLRVAMAHLQSSTKKEEILKSCCERLGLDVNERDYIKIFDILINKLNEMYDLFTDNLRLNNDEGGIE